MIDKINGDYFIWFEKSKYCCQHRQYTVVCICVADDIRGSRASDPPPSYDLAAAQADCATKTAWTGCNNTDTQSSDEVNTHIYHILSTCNKVRS